MWARRGLYAYLYIVYVRAKLSCNLSPFSTFSKGSLVIVITAGIPLKFITFIERFASWWPFALFLFYFLSFQESAVVLPCVFIWWGPRFLVVFCPFALGVVIQVCWFVKMPQAAQVWPVHFSVGLLYFSTNMKRFSLSSPSPHLSLVGSV